MEQSLGFCFKESECHHVGSCDKALSVEFHRLLFAEARCSQKWDAQTDLKCLFFSFLLTYRHTLGI